MHVDEFVERKVLPEYRPIVAMLRELLHETVPDAEELVSYGQPMYRRNGLVFAWLTASGSGIALGFRRGVEYETGTGFSGARGSGREISG